jgi:hypothetical protein
MRSILSAMAAVLVLGNVPAQALAADEPAYLDDRSDAAAIVRSLYNAINRREYARAWSYFGDTKPAKDFESFAKGYENTAQANVLTGGVASEGAAGSLFYYVPVAVASVGIDGSEQVFAGCYTAKLANPQVQDADFQPLHIEKGSLARSDKPHDEAVPEQCPDAPAPEKTDAGLAKVTAAFAATHADHCTGAAPGTDPSQTEPESYTISFRYKSDADNDPERQARLFRFFCSAGAYNESHIYYQQDEMNGLREVHFAMPEIDVRYENDDSEGKVESINVIGYKAEDRLVNSSYDEATLSISSHAKWRGAGDASSSGKWIFRDGAFTLVRYEVDASYDGEINPEAVMDYDTAP